MRDLLTVLAAGVIALLTAALAVPPLIDWSARRGWVDRALGEAAGTPVRTEGRIGVRLLPSPRLRVERLRLGSGAPDAPALEAAFVKTDIALAPLLRGEVRFQDARIGRAELRLPLGPDGGWRVPNGLADGLRRDWALENLTIAQLLLTAFSPATGRTDQAYAEDVRAEAASLAGLWRIEGTAGAGPFRLVTGTPGADGAVPVKLAGGGGRAPRFEIDARVSFPERGGALVPTAAGTATMSFGPPVQAASAGLPIPVVVRAGFKAAGRVATLENLSVEAGEGVSALRLGGTGAIHLDEARAALRLEGKRFDADAFLRSEPGRALLAQGSAARAALPVPVDLDLALSSLALGGDEWSGLQVRAALRPGRVAVEQAEATAPGQTRVALAGAWNLGPGGEATGRVTLAAPASDRFGRSLEQLGLSGPWTAWLDGRPLELAADVTVAAPVTSLRNLRLNLGTTALAGNLRYTAPDEGARGRLDAQLSLQNLDLARMPDLTGVRALTRDFDLGLILDARGVRDGGQAGAGRIAAHVVSDGPELVVNTLDIADLAGADARVSGRLAPDGSGRIAGQVTARRAAPLIDLVGRIWPGLSPLAPPFLREGDLSLDLVAERAAGAAGGAMPLHTRLRGTAAGGPFEAELSSAEGRTERLSLRLATQNTGLWLGRPDAAALQRLSEVVLDGVRGSSGRLAVGVSGNLGGLSMRTVRPFALGAGDDGVEDGEADLHAADATPFLALVGAGAGVAAPVPVQLRLGVRRERDAPLVSLSGRVAQEPVEASLSGRSAQTLSGSVTLDRLSLPWLTAAFALHAAPEARPGAPWPTARFGPEQRFLGGQVAVRARRLDLGRGLEGLDAAFRLALDPDGLTVRDLSATLAGGRLTGGFAFARQGSLASLSGEGALRDARLPDLAGPMLLDGRLSAALRFGASGESLAALVANLNGTGDVTVADVNMPNADPAALDRTVVRALSAPDPLAAGRLQATLAEELGRGPLRAAAVAAPAALVGGVLRISPILADAGPAAWQGAASFDVRTLILEARGLLQSKTAPRGWTGSPPAVGLTWRGPLAAPVREIEAGPLVNGLAALVIQRELDKIEALQAEADERVRQLQRRAPGEAGEGRPAPPAGAAQPAPAQTQ